MNSTELLTVEDSFLIKGRGLVLIPHFSVPNNWKNRVDSAILMMPDGHQLTTNAQFNLTHFNITDCNVPVDKRWRVVVILPDLRHRLPAGTKLFVSADTHAAIIKNPV